VVALQSVSASLQAGLTGANLTMGSSLWATVFVVAPLTAVSAVAAVVMALHSSTRRWCRQPVLIDDSRRYTARVRNTK
jgi:hypothetical protein